MKKSHQNDAINHRNVMAKKAKCSMKRKCQVNDVVCRSDITRPLRKNYILDLQGKNERFAQYYHLKIRDIAVR